MQQIQPLYTVLSNINSVRQNAVLQCNKICADHVYSWSTGCSNRVPTMFCTSARRANSRAYVGGFHRGSRGWPSARAHLKPKHNWPKGWTRAHGHAQIPIFRSSSWMMAKRLHSCEGWPRESYTDRPPTTDKKTGPTNDSHKKHFRNNGIGMLWRLSFSTDINSVANRFYGPGGERKKIRDPFLLWDNWWFLGKVENVQQVRIFAFRKTGDYSNVLAFTTHNKCLDVHQVFLSPGSFLTGSFTGLPVVCHGLRRYLQHVHN